MVIYLLASLIFRQFIEILMLVTELTSGNISRLVSS